MRQYIFFINFELARTPCTPLDRLSRHEHEIVPRFLFALSFSLTYWRGGWQQLSLQGNTLVDWSLVRPLHQTRLGRTFVYFYWCSRKMFFGHPILPTGRNMQGTGWYHLHGEPRCVVDHGPGDMRKTSHYPDWIQRFVRTLSQQHQTTIYICQYHFELHYRQAFHISPRGWINL